VPFTAPAAPVRRKDEAWTPVDLRARVQDGGPPRLAAAMERMVEALDPDAGIEDAYHPRRELGYGFKGLRVAARERIAPLSRLTGASFEHYCLAALGKELPADAFPAAAADVVSAAAPSAAPAVAPGVAPGVESHAVEMHAPEAAELLAAEQTDKAAPKANEAVKAAEEESDTPAVKREDEEEAAAAEEEEEEEEDDDDDDAMMAPLGDEPPSKRPRTQEDDEEEDAGV